MDTTIRAIPLLKGYQIAALLTIAHFTMDMLMSMPMGLLPVFQERFNLTEGALALLVATLSFSSSVTQPIFGAISDRFSRRFVAAAGLVLNAVLLSFVGIIPSFPLLLLLFFIGGLGSGALHPAGASIVRSGVTSNKGLMVSLFSTGGTLGYSLGPVIILYVISGFGLEVTPLFMIPGILLGIAVYFLVPADAAYEHDHPLEGKHTAAFDYRIITGPIGLLSLSGILSAIAFVTFTSAVPLWLVEAHAIAPDDPIIGWTLSIFILAAALGGIGAAAVSVRIDQRILISGSLLLSLFPLFGVFTLEPGTLLFFVAVALSGALVHANLPLMIVSAQNLAPHAMATASGMLMGFSTGIAGLLYIVVGQLQELIGLAPAMQFSFLMVIPAGILAYYVLTKHHAAVSDTR